MNRRDHRRLRAPARATWLLCLVGSSVALAQEPAESRAFDLIDNGDGREVLDVPADDPRAARVPWWLREGPPVPPGPGLIVPAGGALRQPLAAFAPSAAALVIEGRVEGDGVVALIDGGGARVESSVSDGAFRMEAARFRAEHGREPIPRFMLRLESPSASRGARFQSVTSRVWLPLPDEAGLRAELRQAAASVFEEWCQRGVDADGERSTAFLTRRFDAVTGEVYEAREPSSVHPLYECLARLSAIDPDPQWRAWLERYLEDFFTLAFHPDSGMPRDWDGVLDLPQDQKPIQVARCLAFLLDLELTAPEPFRARARAQAERITATMLARGLLPDGAVAVKYVPADGSIDLGVPPIRRLDAAAQIARLGARNGERRLLDAARGALAELELTHFWGGTWHTIDPDFDDSFGNWGSRAVTMLAAFPGEPAFRRFSRHGFEHFAPLWRDALRLGGSIAADQTRCWELMARHVELEPELRAEFETLLRSAVRAHFKGEQYDNGHFGDVTFAEFSPRASLNVGDFTGTPSNLLVGLAASYRRGSGLRDAQTLAMFTAAFRSSRTAYARDHGWLLTREQALGRNPAGGEVRMLVAATEMLEALAR